MPEQKETTKPTKPLTLSTTARSGAAAAKGGETQVRQKFSHGRTRAVTVEVKKPVKRPAGSAAAPPAPAPEAAPAPPTARTLKLGSAGAPARGGSLRWRARLGNARRALKRRALRVLCDAPGAPRARAGRARCAVRRCGRPSTSACRNRLAHAVRAPSAVPTRSMSVAP